LFSRTPTIVGLLCTSRIHVAYKFVRDLYWASDYVISSEALCTVPDLTTSLDVMRVSGVCGENTYELEDGDGIIRLFNLPNRLRHVVFIRPRCFVLARLDDSVGLKSKVKGEINAVILDTHLPELRKHERWPARFAKLAPGSELQDTAQRVDCASGCAMESGGADSRKKCSDDDSSEESDLEENPNQRKWNMYSLHNDAAEDSSNNDPALQELEPRVL
jgi:hypothetical protein